MLSLLITLVVALIVLALAWYVIRTLLPLPEPLGRVERPYPLERTDVRGEPPATRRGDYDRAALDEQIAAEQAARTLVPQADVIRRVARRVENDEFLAGSPNELEIVERLDLNLVRRVELRPGKLHHARPWPRGAHGRHAAHVVRVRVRDHHQVQRRIGFPKGPSERVHVPRVANAGIHQHGPVMGNQPRAGALAGRRTRIHGGQEEWVHGCPSGHEFGGFTESSGDAGDLGEGSQGGSQGDQEIREVMHLHAPDLAP